MRLLAQFDTVEEGRKFFLFLEAHKISCHFEQNNQASEIWILNEDQLSFANEYYESYQAKELELPASEPIQEPPQSERLDSSAPDVIPELPITPRPPRVSLDQINHDEQNNKVLIHFRAVLTRFFIALCVLLYVVGSFQAVQLQRGATSGLLQTFTPIQQTLLYDYPPAYKLAQQFNTEYAVSEEADLDTLPEHGRALLLEIQNNPPWSGLYQMLLKGAKGIGFGVSDMFSSIRKGEVWRIFSPTILHVDLLHLLFNMMWLWMLGKMVEMNIGRLNFTLFILFTAAITNTLQYLMTGPLFMGFSGVISAFGGYIWVRKKNAPWELYPVDRRNLVFLLIFIFGMFALQIIAFFIQFFHIGSFQMRIANTAHVSGFILGMILAKTSLFQRKI